MSNKSISCTADKHIDSSLVVSAKYTDIFIRTTTRSQKSYEKEKKSLAAVLSVIFSCICVGQIEFVKRKGKERKRKERRKKKDHFIVTLKEII